MAVINITHTEVNMFLQNSVRLFNGSNCICWLRQIDSYCSGDKTLSKELIIMAECGRPQGRTFIVDPQLILTNEQLKEQNYILTNLIPSDDKMKILEWLAKHKLIKNNIHCDTFNKEFHLNRCESISDKFRWYCTSCKKKKSVREGSFFSRSHLSLHSILVIMYCWARDMQQKHTCEESGGVSAHTVVDWFNFCRDICSQCLENNPREIGGFAADGSSLVVEIDESKFFHRKYHRGQWREGHWVFGGIERVSGKCFLVEVPDRTRETLEEKIRKYILPGSHIISDGWASYARIEDINDGIYTHQVIVHEEHFVDPDDPCIHTQNVENMWMRVKRKLRRQFGTSDALFTSYLHEFMWRGHFKNVPTFSALILCIWQFYNV